LSTLAEIVRSYLERRALVTTVDVRYKVEDVEAAIAFYTTHLDQLYG
jgi:hypothetical protein